MRKYKTVYGLLKDPKRWTRGTYARDKNKRDTEPLNSDATSFCILGACIKVAETNGLLESDLKNKIRYSIQELFPRSTDTAKFNDDYRHTHADILKLVKHAGV